MTIQQNPLFPFGCDAGFSIAADYTSGFFFLYDFNPTPPARSYVKAFFSKKGAEKIIEDDLKVGIIREKETIARLAHIASTKLPDDSSRTNVMIAGYPMWVLSPCFLEKRVRMLFSTALSLTKPFAEILLPPINISGFSPEGAFISRVNGIFRFNSVFSKKEIRELIELNRHEFDERDYELFVSLLDQTSLPEESSKRGVSLEGWAAQILAGAVYMLQKLNEESFEPTAISATLPGPSDKLN